MSCLFFPLSADSRPADASAWAPRCPQAHAYPAATDAESEDCLFLTIWAPASASNLPVYVYAPGGSNMEGGASSDGLSGAALAGHGLLVVTVQHRTGVLGFLPPAGAASDPNFALRDMLLALRAVKDNIAGAGGDPGAVTLGGQSSGAMLAQALLGVPEAAGLFQRLILQSGALNVGAQTAAQTAALQKHFYRDSAGCRPNDKKCPQRLSPAQLMDASYPFALSAPAAAKGVPFGAVLRPQFGTATLPRDPTNILMDNPDQLPVKPEQVLITTLLHEAGALASVLAPNVDGEPETGRRSLQDRGRKKPSKEEAEARWQELMGANSDAMTALCEEVRSAPDGATPEHQTRFEENVEEWVRLMSHLGYKVEGPKQSTTVPVEDYCALPDGEPETGRRALPESEPTIGRRSAARSMTPAEGYASVLRTQLGDRTDAVLAQYPLGADEDVVGALEAVFTDGGFRCAGRALAGQFARVADTFVGEFTRAPDHANNAQFPYCADHVCHQDDLYAWFGTGPGGADAFARDVMRRVAAFVRTGSPGDGWARFAADTGNVFAIGGGEPHQCPAGFWGGKVKFDFELYSQ